MYVCKIINLLQFSRRKAKICMPKSHMEFYIQATFLGKISRDINKAVHTMNTRIFLQFTTYGSVSSNNSQRSHGIPRELWVYKGASAPLSSTATCPNLQLKFQRGGGLQFLRLYLCNISHIRQPDSTARPRAFTALLKRLSNFRVVLRVPCRRSTMNVLGFSRGKFFGFSRKITIWGSRDPAVESVCEGWISEKLKPVFNSFIYYSRTRFKQRLYYLAFDSYFISRKDSFKYMINEISYICTSCYL